MNKKLGYYTVNNQTFFNKLQAILYASPNKFDIKWNFNDEIFDKFNWSEDPPISLNECYKIRAHQIRDEFDHVILMLSGGADSSNVLYSFLNNNIKIDEVIAYGPFSGIKNLTVDLNDKRPENTVAETIVTQMPLINMISQKYPNIKITLHDYFEDILQMKTDEWIYESAGHWIHYSGSTRHSLDKFRHLRKLAESGKKIAVVYGIDKPVICRTKTGNLYTVVSDPIVNVVTPHFKDKYPNVSSVLFYYTPDFPTLMIKQAHEVCNWIYKPENYKIKSLLWDQTTSIEYQNSSDRGGSWQRSIVPCIYPQISDRFSVWQAQKQGLGFQGSFVVDDWIYKLHKGIKVIDMVESDFKMFIKHIDRKYIYTDQSGDGFLRFFKYWKIGHESQFMSK
jgi:hypothetical protein